MDIQISSNFERLLFFAYGRDAAKVRSAMAGLKQSGAFAVEDAALAFIREDFSAGRADRAEVDALIEKLARETGYVLDPHSAIALSVAGRHEQASAPMVALATAHPAKFPEAVKSACGIDPKLPPWLSGLMTGEERFDSLPADQSVVEDYISGKARAAG